MRRGVAYRCVPTCCYTDTCPPSTQQHMLLLFFSYSQTQHRGLGGISWVEYFRRAVLFWRPAVRTLQSFYFKENALLFYSFIFPLDSFPPIHLRGFCKLFLSVAAAYVAGKKTQQKTDDCTDWERRTHKALNDWLLQFFVLFQKAHTWQKDKDYTPYLKATDFHTVHWHVTRRATEPKQIRKI